MKSNKTNDNGFAYLRYFSWCQPVVDDRGDSEQMSLVRHLRALYKGRENPGKLDMQNLSLPSCVIRIEGCEQYGKFVSCKSGYYLQRWSHGLKSKGAKFY